MYNIVLPHNTIALLSPHFNASEFKCKCGGNHDIVINGELVYKLERLHEIFGAKSIIITSGYRCSKHDISVGGSGSGEHTKGNAADIIINGKDGKPINTKYIACIAQKLGFRGIGRISDTAIHVDVRPGNPWYGDETVKGGTNSNVTTNYHEYYSIPELNIKL